MKLDDLVLDFKPESELEPDWRTPNAFFIEEAEQFVRWMRSSYLQTLPGVGEKLAEEIVDELGEQCLERIDENPEVLRAVAERSGVPAPTIENLIENWRELRKERPAFATDVAIAQRLLKFDFTWDEDFDRFQNKINEGRVDETFRIYRRWYLGLPSLVPSPERTVPGMTDAGKMLSEAIEAGEKIAVFCDYDVDGTTAGEVFRRSVEPYGADLHYGYADPHTGFGLTEAFVREAHAAGAKVLVTLDCGSTQGDKVALAQKLGMKVIVVDHHHAAENPADHHLNPKLYEPASSENTGAQLAWKLGAAVQAAREPEGKTRPEHWQENMQLAGMGCLADMGSVVLPENRAFFWHPHRHPVPGVRALAAELGEDPETPGAMVATQACMNLPKRTAKVSAADVGKLLAARDEKEAEPMVRKLLSHYEEAKPVREKMAKQALEQVGEAVWNDDGTVDRPDPDRYFAVARLDEYPDYAGYSGPVASKVSRAASKPGLVFAYKGRDEHGQDVYKFSTRNDSPIKLRLGDLIDDEEMRKLCTVKVANEDGSVSEAAVIGGHAEIVSGACTRENLEAVVERMEEWAAEQEKKVRKQGGFFWPKAYSGPDAFLTERKVDPDRLPAIEEQARRLGPFTKRRMLAAPRRRGRDDRLSSNRELEVSVVGELRDLAPDPENEKWLAGKLELENGMTREIRYPADEKAPEGKAEWILKVGNPGPYYLRKYAKLRS